jgi:hypothetical protein
MAGCLARIAAEILFIAMASTSTALGVTSNKKIAADSRIMLQIIFPILRLWLI